MPKPDSNFRPDPKRAIYIFNEFNAQLVEEMVPKIIAFRAESDNPITVYISSPGGIIRCLDIIVGNLRGADVEHDSCRFITVASGDCLSAAATLLALGDYAIAHSHSSILFHGARLSDVDVTMEDATTEV